MVLKEINNKVDDYEITKNDINFEGNYYIDDVTDICIEVDRNDILDKKVNLYNKDLEADNYFNDIDTSEIYDINYILRYDTILDEINIGVTTNIYDVHALNELSNKYPDIVANIVDYELYNKNTIVPLKDIEKEIIKTKINDYINDINKTNLSFKENMDNIIQEGIKHNPRFKMVSNNQENIKTNNKDIDVDLDI